MHRYFLICAGLLIVTTTLGCTFQEPRIRSEPLIRFRSSVQSPWTPTQIPVETQAPEVGFGSGTPITLSYYCAAWNPWATRVYDSMSSSFTGASSALDECIYKTIDESTLTAAMNQARNAEAQNEIIRTLESWSDGNCDNFRARVFSFRSNVGYVGGLGSGLLASAGALTALVSGPVAAGLSGASSAVTTAISPIDGDYYSNYTMGQLDASIVQRRTEMKTSIEQKMAAPPPAIYTIAQKISDLQTYDSLCSLETLAANPVSSLTPAPAPASPAAH